jgi:RNase P subunit RPR2
MQQRPPRQRLSTNAFVVTCKRCRRDVPSGVREFPFQSITVECPLCGELRRYLPSEVFLGRPDGLVSRQQRAVRK